MSIRLIALDLDGTLLDSGASIHRKTIAAMNKFVKGGGIIAINTGRPYDAIVRIMKDNNVLPHYQFPHALIAEERELYMRNEHNEFVPDEAWNSHIIQAEHALLAEARSIVQDVENVLAKNGIMPREPNVELENKRGFIERYFNTQKEAIQAFEYTNTMLPADSSLQVVRNNRLIALRHRNVGKGKLLQKLAQRLNIEPQRILAVGDSNNDREMLDGSFQFQAGTVANADKEIILLMKQLRGPIASHPRSLGVAQLIQNIISR